MNTKFIENCTKYSWNNLFPKKVKNKLLVYFINIIHIIGVLVIQFGLFLPPKYLKYYIFYLILLFISYFIFRNQCFMTKISNYFGESYYDSLCIKMTQAKFILYLYLFYATLSIINPNISMYNLITRHFIKY